MKKTVRTIATYLFAVVLAVFCLFTVSAESFLTARAAEGGYDGTNVLDDLKGATVDGEPFRLADYEFDESKELSVLNFVEFGYSFRSDSRQDYALYVYLYNPQGLNFDDDSELNYLQMSYADDNYVKYPLEFLNKSTKAGYEGMFYKYKLALAESQRQAMLNDLSSNKRVYKVSGIELLRAGDYNATEYDVSNTYTYTGYSLGYGPEAATESSLTCISSGLETLTLDVHGAAYTPDGTNGENNYTQDMLHSVYFAVPDETVNEYGGISKIYAQWLNAVTTPIFVTDNNEVYEALQPDLGKTIPEHLEHREQQPFGFASDVAIYNSNHSYDGWEGNFAGEKIDALYYAFLADDKNSYVNDDGQYVLSGDVVLDHVREYSSTHSSSGNSVAGKYSPELFSEYDSDFTYAEIEADDGYSLMNEKLTQSFWEKLLNLPGTVVVDSAFENIDAIYQVKDSDVSDNAERTCDNLYINESYYNEFRHFYDSATASGKTVYIFRYYQSEYECATADVEEWTPTILQPNMYRQVSGKHYVAQTHVSIDFDIIKVRFTKGTVNTEIPVVSSPIDFFPDLEPPVTDYFPWLTVVILMACSVAGVIITTIIERNIEKEQSKAGGSSGSRSGRTTTRRTTKRKTTTKQSKR